ncbi:MAG: exonuclease SbcCD subunit D, partial [Cyanobacteria bacterium J06641_5]
LVLFGGDAFPDATPPPYVQEAFAAQFRRLATAGIATVLLVGNHDQHSQGRGGASLCIYRTLGVPGFIVGDKIATHRIETPNGPVQVVTLPWLTHATLLARPETEGLSLGEIERLLVERLQPILEAEIRRRDRDIPTILLGHLMAERASLGAERFLAVGKGFGVPLSLLVRPEFDYVALGHVHKHQNLNPSNDPPVVYPGSIERVDFSEEKEDKGYVLVTLGDTCDRAEWEFCRLETRPFRTITVDVSTVADPQQRILDAIASTELDSAIARLHYKIRAEQLETINVTALQKALNPAHSYTIRSELASQLARPRVPELKASNSLDPISALQAYLGSREDLQDIAPEMLEAAQKLLAGDDPTEIATTIPIEVAEPPIATNSLTAEPELGQQYSPVASAGDREGVSTNHDDCQQDLQLAIVTDMPAAIAAPATAKPTARKQKSAKSERKIATPPAERASERVQLRLL